MEDMNTLEMIKRVYGVDAYEAVEIAEALREDFKTNGPLAMKYLEKVKQELKSPHG